MAEGKLSAARQWEEKVQIANGMLADVPPVRWAADKMGVQPWVAAAGGSLWGLSFLLWGFTGELLCSVVGHLYPMYASFKALEDGEPHVVWQWLTYWVVYAAVTLAEGLMYRMLVWIPFYHIMRLLFIVWLFHPATTGAQAVFAWSVGPLLRRYRPKIDAALARAAEEIEGPLRGSDLATALRAAKEAAQYADAGAQGMGIEDLVAEELVKAASSRFGKLVQRNANGEVVRVGGARTRTASPRPVFAPLPLQQPAEAACEGGA